MIVDFDLLFDLVVFLDQLFDGGVFEEGGEVLFGVEVSGVEVEVVHHRNNSIIFYAIER